LEGSVVYDHLGGVGQKKTGQEMPSLIQGGFERSQLQQIAAPCWPVSERFTLLFDH
jgi:hypothetical protein